MIIVIKKHNDDNNTNNNSSNKGRNKQKMINKNNIECINDNNNGKNIVTMVIILITVNRKMKLELIKNLLNKFIFHNVIPEKEAAPIIPKVKYLRRIECASNSSNNMKMVKLRDNL